MFSKNNFGERLRTLRKEKKETQDKLAELLDVTKTQISDMERGRRTTTVEKLSVICEYYDVTADYLLGLTDTRRPLEKETKEICLEAE